MLICPTGNLPSSSARPPRPKTACTKKLISPASPICSARSSPAVKIIRFFGNKNHAYILPVPPDKRGVTANRHLTRLAGCGGREGHDDEVPDAYGEIVRSRFPDAGIKPCVANARRRWLSSPVHRGDHVLAVKPLRGERRLFRLPCGCLRAQKCISFARKARGCGQHPVFPAPSLR
jgi:hypothetical protein